MNRPVLPAGIRSGAYAFAETDEAASKKPLAESAARNGGKRKRMGASQQGAAHGANGVPGTSGETFVQFALYHEGCDIVGIRLSLLRYRALNCT